MLPQFLALGDLVKDHGSLVLSIYRLIGVCQNLDAKILQQAYAITSRKHCYYHQCFHFNRTKKVCSSLREYKIMRLSSGISRNISSAVITNEDIRSVLPRSADLEFVQVQNTSIYDVDHRQQGAILSGNGGDAVEFVLSLQAFQFLTRSTLSESTVAKLFKNYLNHTRPRRFFLRTRFVDN